MLPFVIGAKCAHGSCREMFVHYCVCVCVWSKVSPIDQTHTLFMLWFVWTLEYPQNMALAIWSGCSCRKDATNRIYV